MTDKVLIIKMSALGDVMIALPHIEAIVRHHHADQIWLLTSPQYQEIFAQHPALRVMVLDRRDHFRGHSTWATLRWLRQEKFAHIYDLQGNRTSRLLVRFSAARHRVGTQPRAIYTHHPATEYCRHTRYNVFTRLNETLAAAGVAPATAGCPLQLSPAEIAAVEQWQREHDLAAHRYVLLHAGASPEWPSKRWPRDYFAQLAQMITAQGLRCVWIGGPADAEVNTLLSRVVGLDATGHFTTLGLYYLARTALFAVANDSGPMHILANASIPLYSFFGPTDWQRSHAAGQGERVFTAEAACSPCFKGYCPLAKGRSAQEAPACLRNITPERVFRRIRAEFWGEEPGDRP